MPFPDASFTHVISVEAAQHFRSIDGFMGESERVLQPAGKLVFSTFFTTTPEGRAAVRTLIPDHAVHCSDSTVENVMTSISENKNFSNTKVKSIGDQVFPGLEKWLYVIGYHNQWTILWPALYKAGFIDYFIFKTEKMKQEDEQNCESEEIQISQLN